MSQNNPKPSQPQKRACCEPSAKDERCGCDANCQCDAPCRCGQSCACKPA